MSEGFVRPTALAQQWIREVLREGDTAVDATVGNGYDTLFLAQCVGLDGLVHGFDVQMEAIVSAQQRCLSYENIRWHHESHAAMAQHVASARAVMFNLGYLPGADHGCMTHATETIAAIEAACGILDIGGRITVVCYPGHEGGDVEAAAVSEFLRGLSSPWQVVKYEKIGTLRAAPVLYGLTKISH